MRTMQGFQMVMNFLMMPMFFLAGALFPLGGNLPGWLLALTLLGGSTFLGVQVFEYHHLLSEGFNPHVSLFGSTFFTMTGFHGFHVFCGVVCIAWVTGKAFLGKYTQERHQGIETLGLYWHFVDLVWIILFAIVYLF